MYIGLVSGLYWGYTGLVLGLYWSYIGVKFGYIRAIFESLCGHRDGDLAFSGFMALCIILAKEDELWFCAATTFRRVRQDADNRCRLTNTPTKSCTYENKDEALPQVHPLPEMPKEGEKAHASIRPTLIKTHLPTNRHP